MKEFSILVKREYRKLALDERDYYPDLDNILKMLNIKMDHNKEYKRLNGIMNQLKDAAGTLAYKKRIDDKAGALKAELKFEKLLEKL